MTFDDWVVAPLKEVTDNFDFLRVPVKETDRVKGPYPYYGASGVVDYVDSYTFDGEYLLIAEDGENLRTRKTPVAFLANGKFWVNNHAHIVRGNAKANTRYLAYALQLADISGFLTGSTMPKLTQGNLARIPIPIPPLSEQVAIAGVLGALDDKIELNRRMNETLEQMARALFKSWFVDFDPVRAKAEGRRPAGLDAETTALFPDSFVDSPLGEVPAGWEVGPLLVQSKLLSGGTPKTTEPDYWGGSVLWASAKDVSTSRECFLIATERQITESGLANSSTKVIPANATVIVARGATTGRHVLLGRDMAMNQTCYALLSLFDCHFALYCQIGQIVENLVRAAHGSVFDTITTNTFEGTPVLLAPKKIQRTFEARVAPLFSDILLKQQETRTLIELRDSLLPKLLSGEIRIGESQQ